MFSFLFNTGNYEDRKVARYENGDIMISTCKVYDGRQPYETAVAHPAYRDDGLMVIVDAYDTEAAALAGHNKWVKIMTGPNLPNELVDVHNAKVAQVLLAVSDGKPKTFPRRDNVWPKKSKTSNRPK